MTHIQVDLMKKVYSGIDAPFGMSRVIKIVTIILMVVGLFWLLFADVFAFGNLHNSANSIIVASEFETTNTSLFTEGESNPEVLYEYYEGV